MLQFSKTMLKRLLRFTAMVTSFENMMVSPLDGCNRCIPSIHPAIWARFFVAVTVASEKIILYAMLQGHFASSRL
jgi:hypothetical protein